MDTVKTRSCDSLCAVRGGAGADAALAGPWQLLRLEMGLFDMLGAAKQGEDSTGKTARRLAAFGVAGLLVVGAAKATRIAVEANGGGSMVRMVAAAAEAASEAVSDGTFDAANSLVGPGLTKFLQVAPVVTCQLVAVSALKMCMDIKRVKSTATLNPMPFTAMLTNSVVWGLYGFGKRDITSASQTATISTA